MSIPFPTKLAIKLATKIENAPSYTSASSERTRGRGLPVTSCFLCATLGYPAKVNRFYHHRGTGARSREVRANPGLGERIGFIAAFGLVERVGSWGDDRVRRFYFLALTVMIPTYARRSEQ